MLAVSTLNHWMLMNSTKFWITMELHPLFYYKLEVKSQT
jgi:hypothetical protein